MDNNRWQTNRLAGIPEQILRTYFCRLTMYASYRPDWYYWLSGIKSTYSAKHELYEGTRMLTVRKGSETGLKASLCIHVKPKKIRYKNLDET